MLDSLPTSHIPEKIKDVPLSAYALSLSIALVADFAFGLPSLAAGLIFIGSLLAPAYIMKSPWLMEKKVSEEDVKTVNITKSIPAFDKIEEQQSTRFQDIVTESRHRVPTKQNSK